MTAIQPAHNWTWNEVLLNKIAFFAEVLTWQNTKDGQKKRPQNPPKTFVPDFMINVDETHALNRDSVAQDVDSIKEILARPRH
jgi:hypothetical protein